MKLFSVHNKLLQSSQKGLTLRNTKGFTLIELLVVIGILGVLAAALVATIDPFEQLKKANDANVKNTAVEFINANVRYYTTHNTMPWNADPNCNGQVDPSGNTARPAGNWLDLAGMQGCLTALIADGEIKSGFTNVTSVLSSIVVSGSSNGVTACFQPQSKAQQRDLNTKYDSTGAVTNGCVGGGQGGNTTTCFWCSQ